MLRKVVPTKAQAPVLKRLEVFLYEWNQETQAFESPCGPAAKVTAAETFEWLPGELFLLHGLDESVGENDGFIHRLHRFSRFKTNKPN